MVKLYTLKIADRVLVNVGKNEVTAEVLEVRPDKVLVKSLNSGKEFSVKSSSNIKAVIESQENHLNEPATEPAATFAQVISGLNPDAVELAFEIGSEPGADSAEVITELGMGLGTPVAIQPPQAPAPTSAKKRSLLSIAFEILEAERKPMNTREIIQLAVERGLWTPGSGKTPEQTLYASFFLEIKNSANPRIKKCEERGKFMTA